MSKEQEYRAKRILSFASHLAKLVHLDAPQLLIDNAFERLKGRVTEYEKNVIMDSDHMQGSINVADHTILESVVTMYHIDEFARMKDEIKKREEELDEELKDFKNNV